jgi:hypothetical protein
MEAMQSRGESNRNIQQRDRVRIMLRMEMSNGRELQGEP